ncbi:hypothetical protein F5887DRAFT_1171926 [Amanita rubescens]|nr:hypothetical protein F5887DRAFT_1171926 [Amanita rubescens]
MSRAKAAPAAASKASRPQATHPSWIEMIKACIVDHKEYTRQGVSRPQIKKFVEQTYKMEMTPAQNAQLSKALGTGSEKGVFVLPKGPSGRVKLAPKTKTDTSAKEPRSTTTKTTTTKTSTKPAAKQTPKQGKAAAKPTKATTKKQPSKSTAKSTTGTTAGKKAVGRPKSATSVKKATATTKKVQAAKAKPSSTRKSTTTSQRGAAKRSAIGETAALKVKAASKRVPAKAASSKATAKATTAKATPRKKATDEEVIRVGYGLYSFYLFLSFFLVS